MDMDAVTILERTAEVTAPLQRPARALLARAEAGATAAVARVADVDVLRGFVIVLMALDHVRHYFHSGSPGVNPLDPAQTTPLLYATRWITHLCAPTFVLLAGVSAYLQLAHGKTPARLARFLVTRGLWLVALELTVVSFGWSFSFPYPFFLQVIWAIGWSMVALAALVRLPRAAVLAVGVAIVAGHNLLDPLVPEQFGRLGLLWQLLHDGGPIFVGGRPIGTASYPVLPWIGIMALGFGLGPWLARSARRRRATAKVFGRKLRPAFTDSAIHGSRASRCSPRSRCCAASACTATPFNGSRSGRGRRARCRSSTSRSIRRRSTTCS
jgi:uncharacterized membrane protein